MNTGIYLFYFQYLYFCLSEYNNSQTHLFTFVKYIVTGTNSDSNYEEIKALRRKVTEERILFKFYSNSVSGQFFLTPDFIWIQW